MVEEAQHVWQQAYRRQSGKHDIEREAAHVFVASLWCHQRDARHSHDDRDHRDVLEATCTLAKHALAGKHQHEQPRRQRWLHDDQGRKDQGDHLQRPPNQREPRSEQPSWALDQAPHEREPQPVLRGGLPGVHRLVGDPYAVEARGADRREQAKYEIDHERR